MYCLNDKFNSVFENYINRETKNMKYFDKSDILNQFKCFQK